MSDLHKQFPGLARINASGSLSAAQSSNAVMAMDAEHWITLSGKDKGGQKHGGARVKIDDSGKIVGGAGGKLNGRVLRSAKSKTMSSSGGSAGSGEGAKTGGGSANLPDTSHINSSGSISAAQGNNAGLTENSLESSKNNVNLSQKVGESTKTEAKMKKIKDNIEELAAARKRSISEFADAISASAEYSVYFKGATGLHKKLVGSDKQVAWAEKLRASATKDYAFQAAIAIWHGIEDGVDNNAKIKSLNQEFGAIAAGKASTIIDAFKARY